MLAWVMNMGFAASPAGTQPASKPWEQKLGLSLIRLGGTLFALVVMIIL